jgi:L-lactate dehydrogenase complex protein LldG
VRAAIGEGRAVDVPRDYRRTDDAPRAAIVARFRERAADYRARVRRVDAGNLAEAVSGICAEHGAKRIGVPAGLPAAWHPHGVEAVADDGLSAADLDGLDGALTGCALAIAETGTIVLDAGAGQGRRALTLVPDLHVCVVPADRIVGIVPEAVEALAPAIRDGRPLTFVSGPSATSDIELDRVEGVHGPRRLEILIVAAG